MPEPTLHLWLKIIRKYFRFFFGILVLILKIKKMVEVMSSQIVLSAALYCTVLLTGYYGEQEVAQLQTQQSKIKLGSNC
jgi:uncharacterized membrane protein